MAPWTEPDGPTPEQEAAWDYNTLRDQIEACEQQADDAPDPSEQEYEDGFPVHIAGGMF